MPPLILSQPVSPDDQIAVVTTYQGATSLRIHAMGFLEITTIAAHAALEHKTAIDAITPSIMYAIRHATELFLKHVITELSEKYQLSIPPPTGHNLLTLFNDRKDHIKSCLNYEAEHDEHANFDRRAWLAEFGEIITELHHVDPDGQTLRYPTNRDGAANLGGTIEVSVANLERFACRATECFSQFSHRDC